MRKHQAAGFTLVELIVVMAIVAVLAAIIMPVFYTSAKRTNTQTCLNNLHNIGVNLAQYRQDYGVYPAAPLPTYLQTLDPNFIPFGSLPLHAAIDESSVDTADSNMLTAHAQFANEPDSPYTLKVRTPYPDQFEWQDSNIPTWQGPYRIGDENTWPIGKHVTLTFGKQDNFNTADVWTISFNPALPEGWRQWEDPTEVSSAQVTLTEDMPVDPTITPVGVSTREFFNTARANVEHQTIVLYHSDGVHTYATFAIIKQVIAPTTIDPINPNLGGSILLYNKVADRSKFPAGTSIDPGYLECAPSPTSLNVDTQQTDPADLAITSHFTGKNFGLATLFQLYGIKRDLFHCPEMQSTKEVKLAANELAATGGSGYEPYMRYDPLFSGFNTYDVTYNYDQYNNDINYFDARVDFGFMNSGRQLKNPNPPADTVVCWCYGHRPGQSSTYLPGSPDQPDATIPDGKQAKQTSDRILVLWVDGTVASMVPYYTRGNGANRYYRVPPFLYSQGDGRQ